jgi:pimeloyl-ACP methyl ester carboxylesterase
MSYLDRGGVRISYECFGGDGSGGHDRSGVLPLLLTHGFGASARMWEPNIAALAAARPVITWDMRGHGRSDCPTDQAEYTQAACVADMAAVLDACGADRAVIGGLSLGGYLSLAFWMAHPERVAALLLFDTGPGFRSDAARQRWNDRAVATAGRLEADGLRPDDGTGEPAGTAKPDATSKPDGTAKPPAARPAVGLARAARGMLTQKDGQVIGALPSVDVPVLVIVGADDRAFLAAADYLAAKIPAAEHVVIPAAGHICNADQPELFNRHVLAFLDRLGQPGGT